MEVYAQRLSTVSILVGWKKKEKKVHLEHCPTSWDYKLPDVLIFYLMMSPGSAGGERFSRFVKCDERAGSISYWLAELKCNSLTFWTSKLLFEAVKCKSTVAADLRRFCFSLELWFFSGYLKLVNNPQYWETDYFYTLFITPEMLDGDFIFEHNWFCWQKQKQKRD